MTTAVDFFVVVNFAVMVSTNESEHFITVEDTKKASLDYPKEVT